MSSFEQGKEFMAGWIRGRFDDGATCLDVGACDGNWWNRVGGFLTMDAVEIWQPNVDRHQLEQKYRRVWCMDVADLEYEYYDLIIFGDVIEHMDVEKAQKVLAYAREHSKDFIVAVPWQYKQGICYGNQWEIHIQDDLTPEIFAERYPGMEPIWQNERYAYYHDGG